MSRRTILRALGLVGLLLPQTIAAAAAPSSMLNAPSVVVNKAGFTQARSHGGRAFITYGLALANRSTDVDAVGVAVKLNFVDASGRTIASASSRVTLIPAGATFYTGGEVESPPAAHVAALRTSIRVRFGARTHLRLAKVTGVSAEIDDLGGWRVTGALTNPYRQSLTTHHTTACAVILSTRRKIVGGQCVDIAEALHATSLAPHASATVRLSNPGLSILAAGEAFAKVSIDPGPAVLPPSLSRRLG